MPDTGNPAGFDAVTELNEINHKSVWADGCYDGGHFGHANSFRQAKALGTRLIVGVHSDAEIMEHKGVAPLFTELERYVMVGAIRWVDQVAEAPYVTTLETLDKYGCEFCVHGNDITKDGLGNDTYQIVKDAGRYKEIERTAGISTTGIIKRILRLRQPNNNNVESNASVSSYTGDNSTFIITTQKLRAFGSGRDISGCHGNVVLAYGCFDIFHPEHIKYLLQAKTYGKFLLVGVFDDCDVTGVMGPDYPIMKLSERILSVLSCGYVDDVVVGMPLNNWDDVLLEFGVSHIVHPPKTDCRLMNVEVLTQVVSINESVPVNFRNPDEFTKSIVARVESRREEFEQRNAAKEKKEGVTSDSKCNVSVTEIVTEYRQVEDENCHGVSSSGT